MNILAKFQIVNMKILYKFYNFIYEKTIQLSKYFLLGIVHKKMQDIMMHEDIFSLMVQIFFLIFSNWMTIFRTK